MLATDRYVAVIGAGAATPRQAELARACGRLLARAGFVLLSGGLGGVMDASCRGCAAEGGRSVAVLPGTDRAGATPYATFALPTGLGQVRNSVLVNAADAVLAIGGGWGTLNEIALAVRLGKPLVLLESWGLEPPEGTPLGALVTAADPDDAVAAVRRFLGHGSA